MSGYVGHPLVVGWRGSLSSYARDLLPRAVADLDQPSPQQTRALVEVLARHIGDLRDDEEALRALRALAIVECTDGSFRQPGECYLDEAPIRSLLGDAAFVAVTSLRAPSSP